jgi:ribonuclease D
MSDQSTVQVLRGDLPDGLATAFAACPHIAWDVETTGLDWRNDRLGTCQLFAEGVGVAVVSVEDARPARMASLLEDPRVEKIFHHAPFDLRFMVHAWGVRPSAIRCTKVASKLLAPQATNDVHSLQKLVLRYLGTNLPKGRVRTSDWTATSLSAEQLEYAAADVLHLPALLTVMLSALQGAGLANLYDACCAFLPARVTLELGDYPDVFAYLRE